MPAAIGVSVNAQLQSQPSSKAPDGSAPARGRVGVRQLQAGRGDAGFPVYARQDSSQELIYLRRDLVAPYRMKQ